MAVDIYGVPRGHCTCGKCEEYRTPSEGCQCDYCGCVPVKHTDMRKHSSHDSRPKSNQSRTEKDSKITHGKSTTDKFVVHKESRIRTDNSRSSDSRNIISSHKGHRSGSQMVPRGEGESFLTKDEFTKDNTKDKRTNNDSGKEMSKTRHHLVSEGMAVHTGSNSTSTKPRSQTTSMESLSKETIPYKKSVEGSDPRQEAAAGESSKSGGGNSQRPKIKPTLRDEVPRTAIRLIDMKPCKLLHQSHVPYTVIQGLKPDVHGVYKIAYKWKTIYVGNPSSNVIQQLRKQFAGNGQSNLFSFLKSLSEEALEKVSVFWLDETKYAHKCGKNSYLKCIEALQGNKPIFNKTPSKGKNVEVPRDQRSLSLQSADPRRMTKNDNTAKLLTSANLSTITTAKCDERQNKTQPMQNASDHQGKDLVSENRGRSDPKEATNKQHANKSQAKHVEKHRESLHVIVRPFHNPDVTMSTAVSSHEILASKEKEQVNKKRHLSEEVGATPGRALQKKMKVDSISRVDNPNEAKPNQQVVESAEKIIERMLQPTIYPRSPEFIQRSLDRNTHNVNEQAQVQVVQEGKSQSDLKHVTSDSKIISTFSPVDIGNGGQRESMSIMCDNSTFTVNTKPQSMSSTQHVLPSAMPPSPRDVKPKLELKITGRQHIQQASSHHDNSPTVSPQNVTMIKIQQFPPYQTEKRKPLHSSALKVLPVRSQSTDGNTDFTNLTTPPKVDRTDSGGKSAKVKEEKKDRKAPRKSTKRGEKSSPPSTDDTSSTGGDWMGGMMSFFKGLVGNF